MTSVALLVVLSVIMGAMTKLVAVARPTSPAPEGVTPQNPGSSGSGAKSTEMPLPARSGDAVAKPIESESHSSPQAADDTALRLQKNPLNAYMEATEARGVKVIDRYRIDDGILYIELNEATWASFTNDEEHRLCDVLAQTDFIVQMKVPVAYLTLDGGKTTVGDISHDGLSPHCIFEPNKDYWKYK